MGEVFSLKDKKKITPKELEKISGENNSKDLRDEVNDIVSGMNVAGMTQKEMVEKAGEMADFLVPDDEGNVRKIGG